MNDKLPAPEVENPETSVKSALEYKPLTLTKVGAKEFIQRKLSTSEKWAYKALLEVYALQTVDEKENAETKYVNRVGFTGVDAKILTSFATQLRRRGFLTAKQLIILYKKMPKYWEQIFNVSNKDKLSKLMGASV
ncbi:MAG: hypothetical protein HQK96_08040 [Nitrospirae bacterium]|nr:hypothetical protein [Nitrospirota bacterium]